MYRRLTCASENTWWEYQSTRPTPLHVRSAGRFLPNRASTTDTCLSSLRIEAALGSSPPRRTITTRCSQVEAVFLRSEANRVNSSIKSSVMTQSKNPRIFSEGKREGSDNSGEKRRDTPVRRARVRALRAGKDDGSNVMGSMVSTKRSSRMLARGSTENSANGSPRE